MATKVYLGYPPPNVRRWIEEEYRKRKTIIIFDDESTEEYDWSGEVNQQTFIDAGIYGGEYYAWLKNPVSIQFGTTVTQIKSYTFKYCDSLTSVSMPNVTTVSSSAFESCTSLTSVSMSNATEIGESAFQSCTSLTSVSMPNVTTVGYYAFSDCTSLTSVSMPNVTTVGSNAFSNCTSLTSVSMSNAETVDGYVFGNISTSVEFENQTTSKISEWFGNYVFGEWWGPVTVTCFNGSVYAEWDDSEYTWNLEITPAQQ